jgi:hypothetical protein
MSGMGRFGLMIMVAFAAGCLTVRAVAEEPQLAQALSALSDARAYLSETSDNKGGHPQKAIALIAQAEAEIRSVAP